MNKNLLIENGIDIEKGIELLGDIDTYNEMLNDFLDEVNEKLTNLETYKNNNDMGNYAILAHSLKSDSKYFGFTKLIELAYNHELQSKDNNITFVQDNYVSLKEEAERIIEVVKEYLNS